MWGTTYHDARDQEAEGGDEEGDGKEEHAALMVEDDEEVLETKGRGARAESMEGEEKGRGDGSVMREGG